MIYFFDSLVETLRSHCNNVKHRIWICTPFIGGIKDVLRIIGGSWKRNDIDFRVITDIETGFIRQDTFNEFINNHPNSIRSLKVYMPRFISLMIGVWSLQPISQEQLSAKDMRLEQMTLI